CARTKRAVPTSTRTRQSSRSTLAAWTIPSSVISRSALCCPSTTWTSTAAPARARKSCGPSTSREIKAWPPRSAARTPSAEAAAPARGGAVGGGGGAASARGGGPPEPIARVGVLEDGRIPPAERDDASPIPQVLVPPAQRLRIALEPRPIPDLDGVVASRAGVF